MKNILLKEIIGNWREYEIPVSPLPEVPPRESLICVFLVVLHTLSDVDIHSPVVNADGVIYVAHLVET